MKPQRKLWKQVPRARCGVLNPPLRGIVPNSIWLLGNSTNASNFTSFVFSVSHYNLPIPLRFAFGIGVSTIIILNILHKNQVLFRYCSISI
jgi:hypothetical protein